MIEHGFKAVRASLDPMYQVHAESALGMIARNLMLRIVDVLPPLQRTFLDPR